MVSSLLLLNLSALLSRPLFWHVLGVSMCLRSGRLQSPFLSKTVYESERPSSPQRQASPVPAGSASPVRATGVSLKTPTHSKNPYTTYWVTVSYSAKSCMLHFSLLFLCVIIFIILKIIISHASIECIICTLRNSQIIRLLFHERNVAFMSGGVQPVCTCERVPLCTCMSVLVFWVIRA